MGTTIVFETHATTVDNERGIATGWLPGRLSETGRAQAERLGRRIAQRSVDAIFASDLRRSRQTVELATEGAPVPVFFDWRLRECNYGALNGAAKSMVSGMQLTHVDAPYPDGESWRDALDRVDRALADVRRMWPAHVVVVVGHVATRWALERTANGRTLEDLATEQFAWQPGWTYSLS